MAADLLLTNVKDIQPGQKNINVIFIVLEIGKERVNMAVHIYVMTPPFIGRSAKAVTVHLKGCGFPLISRDKFSQGGK